MTRKAQGNINPLRSLRYNSAEIIRIPTRERKLDKAHFCLPSRPNALLQMMLNATSLTKALRLQYCDDLRRGCANVSAQAHALLAVASSSVPSFCNRQMKALTVSYVSIVVMAAGIALIRLVPIPL